MNSEESFRELVNNSEEKIPQLIAYSDWLREMGDDITANGICWMAENNRVPSRIGYTDRYHLFFYSRSHTNEASNWDDVAVKATNWIPYMGHEEMYWLKGGVRDFFSVYLLGAKHIGKSIKRGVNPPCLKRKKL